MERSCRRCGTTAEAPDGGLPAGWSLATEGDAAAFVCAPCTRAHVRDIEAKLPEDWWEASGS